MRLLLFCALGAVMLALPLSYMRHDCQLASISTPRVRSSPGGNVRAPVAARRSVPSPERFVRAQVTAHDLTANERRWERIHWVSDVDQAAALSRRTHRPIFAFCKSGLLDGRC